MRSLRLLFSNLRYFAPAWVFASLNIIIGTWVLYIPYVKDKLRLDDGQLGLVLFFLALGTLTMIPIASRIIFHTADSARAGGGSSERGLIGDGVCECR